MSVTAGKADVISEKSENSKSMSCVDGSLFASVLFCFGIVVRYSLVSGLFARCLLPLALMVSANKVLFRFTDNYVLDIYQVFPIPGLTGSPSHKALLGLL